MARRSLLTDQDAAGLREAFAVPYAGGVAAGRWCLAPKLGYEGWWFACFWGWDRTWTAMYGEFPGDAPEGTASFPSLAAAELAASQQGIPGMSQVSRWLVSGLSPRGPARMPGLRGWPPPDARSRRPAGGSPAFRGDAGA